jgi:hypothetical protein
MTNYKQSWLNLQKRIEELKKFPGNKPGAVYLEKMMKAAEVKISKGEK